MSSLDELINWDLFKERAVPTETLEEEIASPTTDITTFMQEYHALQEQDKQTQDQIRETYLDILAQQSVLITKLELTLEKNKQKLEDASLKKLYRTLNIIQAQMIGGINKAELEVIDPLGQTFNEISDSITVLGWRHHEQFTEDVVAEVIEPIVRYQGQLIRAGVVIMGAPAASENPSQI